MTVPTPAPKWPKVGEVDPLTMLDTYPGVRIWCTGVGPHGVLCVRGAGHPAPHVESDWADDRLYETTEVRSTWLTLSGDDALAPVLEAIRYNVHDPEDCGLAIRAVLAALGVGVKG